MSVLLHKRVLPFLHFFIRPYLFDFESYPLPTLPVMSHSRVTGKFALIERLYGTCIFKKVISNRMSDCVYAFGSVIINRMTSNGEVSQGMKYLLIQSSKTGFAKWIRANFTLKNNVDLSENLFFLQMFLVRTK